MALSRDDNRQAGSLAEAELNGMSRRAAETELLTVHHGELSGLIAQHWGLPHRIVAGVSYHHTPLESTDPVAYVTYLACHISALLTGNSEGEEGDFVADSLDALGLDRGHGLDELSDLTARRYAVLEACYHF